MAIPSQPCLLYLFVELRHFHSLQKHCVWCMIMVSTGPSQHLHFCGFHLFFLTLLDVPCLYHHLHLFSIGKIVFKCCCLYHHMISQGNATVVHLIECDVLSCPNPSVVLFPSTLCTKPQFPLYFHFRSSRMYDVTWKERTSSFLHFIK